MTREEKQLLLKDICSRLPYEVKLGFKNSSIILTLKNYDCFTRQLFTSQVFPEHDGTIEYGYQIYDYRPYLRPMSSMTEEEEIEFVAIGRTVSTYGVHNYLCILSFDELDWLNAHHFDYRGLIEKGLALEAPENMYE